MDTGPTGAQGTQELAEMTGFTGMFEMESYQRMMFSRRAGADQSVMAMSSNTATGSTEEPTIATMEELLASHAAVVAQEAADAVALACLSAPTRDGYRTQLFQWAALGFPDLYIVRSVSVTPPSICADGVTREIGKYAEYLIGKDLGTVVSSLSAMMTGIQPSWSVSGNTLRIHVTKL